MVCVHGFTPYFYVSLPPSTNLSDTFLGEMRTIIDNRIKEKSRGEEKKLSSCVLGIERVPNHQSLLGYHFDKTRDFIKVRISFSIVPTNVFLFSDILRNALFSCGH